MRNEHERKHIVKTLSAQTIDRYAPPQCPVCGSDDTGYRQKLMHPHGYQWVLVCWTCRAWSVER
jgi:hypothetical protein